jgi:hypothetical protein
MYRRIHRFNKVWRLKTQSNSTGKTESHSAGSARVGELSCIFTSWLTAHPMAVKCTSTQQVLLDKKPSLFSKSFPQVLAVKLEKLGKPKGAK